jgi:NAD(P)-dependent dehydrogenase (short-subunit alcohol dehydrogenase family)
MRKVLITAGASGIGRHFAKAFPAAGDAVYTCDIDAAVLAAAAADLKGLKTGVCNMGDPVQIEAMVVDAAAQLGGIDVLVNNAGISGPTVPVKEVDVAEWEQVLQVDLTGTFVATKHAITHLIRSGNGVTIIMSSAGRFGYPNRSPYSTVKWGLIGFMKTLANGTRRAQHSRQRHPARGRRRRSNPQRMFEGRARATGKSIEEIKQIAMANQSIQRLVDPNDIAAPALFWPRTPPGRRSLPIHADMQRNQRSQACTSSRQGTWRLAVVASLRLRMGVARAPCGWIARGRGAAGRRTAEQAFDVVAPGQRASCSPPSFERLRRTT